MKKPITVYNFTIEGYQGQVGITASILAENEQEALIAFMQRFPDVIIEHVQKSERAFTMHWIGNIRFIDFLFPPQD
jgi:hypothetical protein